MYIHILSAMGHNISFPRTVGPEQQKMSLENGKADVKETDWPPYLWKLLL